MRRPMSRLPTFFLFAFASLPLVACGGGSGDDSAGPDAPPPVDAAVAPVFRNPLPDVPDGELALHALQLLGADVDGADRNCNACHGLSKPRLRAWLDLSEASMSDCLTDLAVTSQDAAIPMIDCLRDNPAIVDSPFAPQRLGFYAVGAGLPWFEYLFELGHPDGGAVMFEDFKNRVWMPRGGHEPFTQSEFDVVAEWVARGLPQLDELLPDGNTGTCTPSITPGVAAHVDALATTGWAAVNAENGIAMLGCAGTTDPRDCLTSFPDNESETYAAGWDDDLPAQTIRILKETNFSSSYWTRSSADGRYVAMGGDSDAGGGSTIIDLTDSSLIGTAAYYDPGFFPDNSGFAFQGERAYFCNQSILATDDYISYQEPECLRSQAVGLYQHLGAALGGGDYWTIDGQFANDNGAHDNPDTDDPPAESDGSAGAHFVPLVHTGTTYATKPSISKSLPYEGDLVISPSARLLVSRVAGAGNKQNGFVLRRVDATPSGDSYSIEVPEIARYCERGGKPAFSYDERWMVFHHYVTDDDAVDLGFTGPSDPAFAAYRSQGAANLYLLDLKTGDKTRLTNVGAGQYALYPHFRSDGWIYFLVRTLQQTGEVVAATDAALVVGGQ
jgi:hypothetical protein